MRGVALSRLDACRKEKELAVSQQIKRFLGLRQDPQGDVNLELGEAAVMRNFRITEGYHLQIRPGTKTVLNWNGDSPEETAPKPVQGMFYGTVGGVEHFLVAQGGHVWKVNVQTFVKEDLGTLTDAKTSFFSFGGKVYILNGTEYCSWNGTGVLQTVAGYVPLVAVSVPPGGGGTQLESLNVLTGAKRQRFSPDGTETVFQLGETELTSVDRVESQDGSTLPEYTTDLTAGTVTFSQAPGAGVNTIEIQWTKGTGQRDLVEHMRFAECFNGASDTRVFLYGDGTNQTIYSGLTEEGMPTAEYFPGLNVLSVDRENTEITGLIRHGEQLLATKPDGTFSIGYGTLTLEDESVIAAFYVKTINREIGNQAPGQVHLLANWPYTLMNGSMYRWNPASSVRDERNAVRVSQRVEQTLRSFDLKETVCFDDGVSQEYYICCGNLCLVYQYGLDVWYLYDWCAMTAARRVGENLYFGTADGRLVQVSRQHRSDDGEGIDALWQSGSMDFGVGEKRFHLLPVTVSMQPEASARVILTMQSNRKAVHRSKTIAYSYNTFSHVNFAHYSFRTNQRPQKRRVRIPVYTASYYRLVFQSCSASATATILKVQMQASLGNLLH